MQGLAVIESPHADQLPQELKGRLGPKLLDRGHVQVVHKDHCLFRPCGPQATAPLGLELGLDHFLGLGGGGTVGKLEAHNLQAHGFGRLTEDGLHDDGLAHTAHTVQQYWLGSGDQGLDEVRVPYGVGGGDQDAREGEGWIIREPRDAVLPQYQAAHLPVWLIVVIQPIRRARGQGVKETSGEGVELLLRLLVDVPSNGPYIAEGEEHIDGLGAAVRHRRIRLPVLIRTHEQFRARLGEQGHEEVTQTLHQVDVRDHDQHRTLFGHEIQPLVHA
mmetsp:Transcript_115663/g.201309  ORF Transcript_115663/g.201309 Transcript_115663/m.201309 type:complete len:274 (+) Transcript_115663:2134-2955(+)